MNDKDSKFYKALKRLKIKFCNDNAIVLTRLCCFIASLGSKFSYPTSIKDNKIFDYLTPYEKIKSEINEFGILRSFNKMKNAFIKKFSNSSFKDRTNI